MALAAQPEISSRDQRQAKVYQWVKESFGESNTAVGERVLRFVEEAIELAQSEGVTTYQLRSVIDHVYGKPPGDPLQEVGGVGITLLAYCAAKGVSADDLEESELRRVLLIDPEYFRKRHNLKADAGIAQRVQEREKT